MINASEQFNVAVNGDIRRMYLKAVLDLTSPDMVYGANTSSGESAYSDGLIHDKVFETEKKYATCETDRVRLDGTATVYPDAGSNVSNGFLSTAIADANGNISAWVQLNFSNVSIMQACSVYFPNNNYDGVAEDFTVDIYSGDTSYYTATYTGNTSASVSVSGFTVNNPTAIRVTVSKWSIPNRFMRVCEILPGIYEQWSDDTIAELTVTQEVSPSCLSLPYGVCTLKMDNASRRFEPRKKDGLFLSIEERQGLPISIGCKLDDGTVEYKPLGIFYQYSSGWKTGDNGLTIQWDLVDVIGLLANRAYIAPATLPTTLSGWVASIVAQLGVNFESFYSVDSVYASTSLTCTASAIAGKTCGDILRWICQASGTFARADAETGYLCVEPTWSGGKNITLDDMSTYPVIKANDDIGLIIIKLSDGTQKTYGGNNSSSSLSVNIENPFISTATQASALAQRVLSFYGGNTYEINERANPCAELGDVDRIQLDQSQATNARRTKQSFAFSGGILATQPCTLIQPNGAEMYQNVIEYTQSGTYTLPSVTKIHLILVGGGSSGTAGTNGSYSSAGQNGTDGVGGKVWYSDLSVNSGASISVTIGGTGEDTSVTIGGVTYSSGNGSRYNGFSDLLTGNVFGRDGVAVPTNGSGDGGAGGAGGVQGHTHTQKKNVLIGYDEQGCKQFETIEVTVIDNYPTNGTAGKTGASGSVIIWYEV